MSATMLVVSTTTLWFAWKIQLSQRRGPHIREYEHHGGMSVVALNHTLFSQVKATTPIAPTLEAAP